MAEPEPTTSLLGQAAYQFYLVSPMLPTYAHVLAAAVFAISTGAHASLSHPASAAAPAAKNKKTTIRRRDGGTQASDSGRRMEGLSPSDAILYPLCTGAMLVGLYYLIQWLQDPELLNRILNWYLSVFGVFAISRLLSDGVDFVRSFAFPARYADGGVAWKVRSRKCIFVPLDTAPSAAATATRGVRRSPLPGMLSRLPLPSAVCSFLWWLRDYPTRPLFIVTAYLRSVLEAVIPVTPQGLSSISAAVSAVLYFNLVDKPWWLTNVLGFSFSYSALQLLSPTTFWTGTLVLTSLFFYDIYFVFFTPMMITVATKLDIPVKLLFPRPSGADEDPDKQSLAMLGLGDIVLPGIMMGLALRFDLYLFYLRMQKKKREVAKPDSGANEEREDRNVVSQAQAQAQTDLAKSDATLVYDDTGLGKVEYKHATGGWGERFWLGEGKRRRDFDGGAFPKTYFYASVFGYVAGLVCTLGVMHVFKHGQPALLYLVPGVLLSLWGTALLRGEIKDMWEYTEAEEEEENAKEKKKEKEEETKKAPKPETVQQEEKEKKEEEGEEEKNMNAKSVDERVELIKSRLNGSAAPTKAGSAADGSKSETVSKPEPTDPATTKPSTTATTTATSTNEADGTTISKQTLLAFSIDLPTPSTRSKKARGGTVKIESAIGEDLEAIASSPLIGGEADSEDEDGDEDGEDDEDGDDEEDEDGYGPRKMSVVYYDEGEGDGDGGREGGRGDGDVDGEPPGKRRKKDGRR